MLLNDETKVAVRSFLSATNPIFMINTRYIVSQRWDYLAPVYLLPSAFSCSIVPKQMYICYK